MSGWGGILIAISLRGGVLSLFVALVYLLARRRGPASGARAAVAGLVGFAMIAVLGVSPWPRWVVVRPAVVSLGEIAAEDAKSRPPRRTEVVVSSDDRPSRVAWRPAISISRPAADLTTKNPAPPARAASFSPPSTDSIEPVSRPVPWGGGAAGLFLVGVGFGCLRLAGGLRGVRRLRRSSRLVRDPRLIATTEALRAAMGIGRRVEIRETPVLTSPATTGWLRPTLYLPGDWTEWTEAERLVVLSHELAHVGRGDYPAWVLAQLGVIAQFYQPVAHWLIGRLRLEQELAADEWAARHAGGRPLYLATLAGLALRQDGRPAAWPARPLFPARKTLIRRIEMLRLIDIDRNPNVQGPLSRGVIPGLLIVGTLIVAGVRGPAGGASSVADPTTDGAPLRETTPARPGPTFDPALIPGDAVLVAGFRPAELIKLPELKALLEEFTREEEMQFARAIAEPESIEQIAFVVLKRDLRIGQDMDEQDLINSGLIIIRTNKPREWKALAMIGGIMSQKATHLGREYYRLTDGDSKHHGFDAAYYQADDMTVVAGSEANIKAVIARDKPQTDASWTEAVRQAARGHGFLALDVAWARGQMTALKNLAKQDSDWAMLTLALAPTAPLQELVERQVITLDGAEGLAIESRNFCRDEAGAERVRRTIDALLVLGQNSAGGPLDPFRDLLRKEAGTLAPLIDLGEQALKDGRVERDGTTVRFRTAVKGPLVQKLRPVIQGM